MARVAWTPQALVGAITVADFKICDITVLRNYDTDKKSRKVETFLFGL